jgi:transposase
MKKYDEEFKREAVRKIHDGQSVASVSRELGVSANQLHLWKKAVYERSTDSEREMIVLKKRLREVEMERDILKKAALIFGKNG